jgi:hypothetical protein
MRQTFDMTATLATGAINFWFARCMREGQDENCLLLTTDLLVDSAVIVASFLP